MSGANIANISTRNTTMSSSPRFAFSNSVCINKGVIFQSATNDNTTVGPGYYSVPRNDFIKKSHNVRVRGPENYVRSAQNTPVTTPLNSPFKRQPTTEVRQVYRPLSAANSPARPGSASSRSSTPNSVQRPRSGSTPRSGTTTPSASVSLASSGNRGGSRGNSQVSNGAPSPNSRGQGLFSERGGSKVQQQQQQQGQRF